MRFIPTKVHGIMDYAVGGLIAGAPLLNAAKKTPEKVVPLAIGLGSTAYSLFSKHELGAVQKLPMKYHLAIDVIAGSFLAVSPWLFNMDKRLRLPFLGAGLFEVATALFTKTESKSGKGPLKISVT